MRARTHFALKNGFAERGGLLCRAIRYVATFAPFINLIVCVRRVIYLYDHSPIGGRTTKIKLAAANFIPEIIVFARRLSFSFSSRSLIWPRWFPLRTSFFLFSSHFIYIKSISARGRRFVFWCAPSQFQHKRDCDKYSFCDADDKKNRSSICSPLIRASFFLNNVPT